MSTGIEGTVLLVPLAVVGGAAALSVIAVAAAATAIAGAGAVVARELGRGVIACGRELRHMTEENLAMQKALWEAARQADQELFSQKLNIIAGRGERYNQMLEEARKKEHEQEAMVKELLRKRTTASKATAPVFADFQSLREDLLNAAPPPKVRRFENKEGWPRKVRRLEELASKLASSLEHYRTGPATGLFDIAGLEQALTESRAQIKTLDEKAGAVENGSTVPDIALYSQVLGTLSYLDHRLEEMSVQLPHREESRNEALNLLEKAHQALRATSTKVGSSASTSQVAALKVAAEMLDEALEAIKAVEFERAQSAAQAVSRHLALVLASTQEERSRNLLALLEGLKARVEPLAQLPELKSAVERWLALRTMCEQAAQRGDLEGAWDLVNREKVGLAPAAETLQKEALRILQQASSGALAGLSAQILEEMGYKAEARTRESGKEYQVVAARQGKRYIYAQVYDSGEVNLKFEGYEGESCQKAFDEFYTKLRAKGVQGAWQPQFNLSDALDRLVGALQQAGLDLRIEPGDDGVTVLATGRVGATATIDYDGKMSLSAEMQSAFREGHASSPGASGTLTPPQSNDPEALAKWYMKLRHDQIANQRAAERKKQRATRQGQKVLE
ncbi:MAG TPA: hypothetical protein VJ183_05220 [Chloroflexia bacterium]|nr:hypothetical protein [Chloroflexia bacterium]